MSTVLLKARCNTLKNKAQHMHIIVNNDVSRCMDLAKIPYTAITISVVLYNYIIIFKK